MHWCRWYQLRILKTGHRLPAPGRLSGVKSSLSTELEQLGRTGECSPVGMQGNPMLSNQLRRMVKGFKADAASKGYQQRAAEPIYSGKIQAMLQFLLAKQYPLTGKDKLLLIRDGLLISMLWQSCFRGVQCGRTQAGKHQNTHHQPSSALHYS